MGRSGRGSRAGAIVAFVIAVAMLPLSLGSAIVDHRHAVDVERRALAHEAARQATLLADRFARSRAMSQLTARNPAFGAALRATTPAARAKALRSADDALAYLSRLYPGTVLEASFLNWNGAELARAVRGASVTPDALEDGKQLESYWDAAVAQPKGSVHQSRPLMSRESGEWAISNTTLLPTPGPGKEALIHHEVSVESLRRDIARAAGSAHVYVVDAETGSAIIDSLRPQRHGPRQPLGTPADRRFASLGVTKAGAGFLRVGDRAAAFQHVQGAGENAWYAVAVSRQPSAGWLGSVTPIAATTIAAAVVLLLFGGVSLLGSQRHLHAAAMTDPVTGLGNRRQMTHDLERQVAAGGGLTVAVFDLDGFKAYNDAFGHAAGDALLARLGQRLRDAVAGAARVYRMGGDEFCVVCPDGPAGEHAVATASDALFEAGESFVVSASVGVARLPCEATDVETALVLADQRMYAHKRSGRASAGRQTTDVLLRVLAERDPDLGEHVDDVAELCWAVGVELGLSVDALEALNQAAALHDVGKAAIPDAILNKPGPLDDDEWAFMREHTIIGERIMLAAPSLRAAAELVRASHERVDGRGYPDGRAGEAIPLGARIIAVCDAYDAMVSDRPYRAGAPAAEALRELRRCAGTQFDPRVVEALCVVHGRRPAPAGSLHGEPATPSPCARRRASASVS
jgi:diguanylate cyclase (GGDEF)-like protein